MDIKHLNNIKNIFIRNKFVLTGAIFFIWISLFSESNCYRRNKLNEKRDKLIEQKNIYIAKIKQDSTKLELLKTNSANLEKFARENHLMSKKNEEIFVITEK